MGRLPAAAKRGTCPRATRIVGLWLAPLLCAGHSYAQQAPPEDGPHYTLHAYSNLVDVPTLVLSRSGDPLPPIDAAKFGIRLDDGPRFHPSYVRREADDPISLAVLIDLSGSENDLLPALSKAVHGWAAGSLHPADRVSIYAIDCHLIRTLKDAPADPDLLQTAVDNAIHDPGIHGRKTHSACGNSLHLWDALAFIAQDLGESPGRRVLLTFTDGGDSGSVSNELAVQTRAVFRSITFFNLTLPAPSDPFPFPEPGAIALQKLCAVSGGLALTGQGTTISSDLDKVVAMLRGRYILEFRLPSHASRGFHRIAIAVDHHDNALIRSAGISVPLPDPALQNDPNAVPRDDSNDPKLGKHQPNSPSD